MDNRGEVSMEVADKLEGKGKLMVEAEEVADKLEEGGRLEEQEEDKLEGKDEEEGGRE
jgi:hypothetical protein